MNQGDLFQQDWHDCLRAHFEYVIRERDALNESSLITVLHEVGYGMEDIASLRTEIAERLGLPEPIEEAPESLEAVPDEIDDSVETTPALSSEDVEPARDAVNADTIIESPEPAADAFTEEAAPIEPSQDEPPEPPELPIVQMSLF